MPFDWNKIPPPKPTLSEQAWEQATAPLTDLPSRVVKPLSERLWDYGENTPGVRGTLGRVGGAYTQALGDVVTSLTSPLSLVLAALTGGSSLATKAGLGPLARVLDLPGKAAALGMVGHGGYRAVEEPTTAGKVGGAIEALLGGLGLGITPRSITRGLHGGTPSPILATRQTILDTQLADLTHAIEAEGFKPTRENISTQWPELGDEILKRPGGRPARAIWAEGTPPPLTLSERAAALQKEVTTDFNAEATLDEAQAAARKKAEQALNEGFRANADANKGLAKAQKTATKVVGDAQDQAAIEDATRRDAAIAQSESERQATELEKLRKTYTDEEKPDAITETITGPGIRGGKGKATFRDVPKEKPKGGEQDQIAEALAAARGEPSPGPTEIPTPATSVHGHVFDDPGEAARFLGISEQELLSGGKAYKPHLESPQEPLGAQISPTEGATTPALPAAIPVADYPALKLDPGYTTFSNAVENNRLKLGEPDVLEGAGNKGRYGKPFAYDTSPDIPYDQIGQLSPGKQDSLLQTLVAKFLSEQAKSERGAINPYLAQRLGWGALGGATGYAEDPLDNPPLSAAAGLALGLAGPSLYKRGIRAISENQPRFERGLDYANQAMHTGLIGPTALVKKIGGDLGNMALASILHPSAAAPMLRQFTTPEGRAMIAQDIREGFKNPAVTQDTLGPGNFLQTGPLSWIRRSLGATTQAAKGVFGEGGFTPEEQRYWTFSNTPYTAPGSKLHDIIRDSKIGQALAPIARMGINRTERAIEFSPLGLLTPKMKDLNFAQEAAKKGLLIGPASMYAAYKMTPEGFVKEHPTIAPMIAAFGGALGPGIAATMAAKQIRESPDAIDWAKQFASGAGELIRDVPGLRPLEDLKNPRQFFSNYLARYTNALKPLARLTNPEEPNVSSKDLSLAEKLFYPTLANVPYFRGLLPVKGGSSPEFVYTDDMFK